jgi:hypothetical protein
MISSANAKLDTLQSFSIFRPQKLETQKYHLDPLVEVTQLVPTSHVYVLHFSSVARVSQFLRCSPSPNRLYQSQSLSLSLLLSFRSLFRPKCQNATRFGPAICLKKSIIKMGIDI